MLNEELRALLLRVKAAIFRRRLDRDLQAELEFHLAMRAQEFGDGPAAEAAAKRRFGNPARIRETCRELWTFAPLETLWQDLRYAFRTLAGSPAFSAIAVVSIALGVGANVALFSLMNVMLLQSLPVTNAQELVEFVRAHPDGAKMTNLPFRVFEHFRRTQNALADVFAIDRLSPEIRIGDYRERVRAHGVSGTFFMALGVQAWKGRHLNQDDDLPGAVNHVTVISHAYWQRKFGSDPLILGASVRLSGERFTIVGIMPPGFFGIDRATVPDLWIPLAANPHPNEVWILGRMRPGASIPAVRAQLEPVFHQALGSLASEFDQSPAQELKAFLSQKLLVNSAAIGTSVVRWSYWDYSSTLKILLGLSGLVLLIACTNLANLLSARSAARSREIGIRLALGAGRWRLVRQLMTESLLVSLAGGGFGVLIAGWGHQLLLGFLVQDPLSAAMGFQLDSRLLGVSLALSIATGLSFGTMPAIRATQADKSGQLHHAGRPGGISTMPLTRGLLAVQIGLSMILLMGAGLFSRSLANLGVADIGIRRDNLLLLDVEANGMAGEKLEPFWKTLTHRLSGLPGVSGVALAGNAVFGNGGWNETIWMERRNSADIHANVSLNVVGPEFFATAGIPIVLGREFGQQDRGDSPRVAVVNQSFARRYFGSENPIGRRFGTGQALSRQCEIVGVVGDAKYGSIREKDRAMVFHPLWQRPASPFLRIHVRTFVEPTGMASAIRSEIQSIGGEALVSDIRSLPQVIGAQLRQDRMFATLASFFALLALALGAIGIYGMVAYRATRRTTEIGVRMALGAQRGDVLWLVIRETLVLLGAGIALGAPASLMAARLVKSQLYALDPWDPATIATSVLVLLAAGTLASFLPARRAASMEPTLALRRD